MPNGLDIVAQCMQFVSQHVESTQLGSFACSATHCPWFGSFGAPVSCMSCCFTRDIICLEVGTTLAQELVKHLTKVPCTIAEMEKTCLSVHTNLSKCMPGSELKEKIEDDAVIRLGEQTIEDWDRTLRRE